MRQQQFTVGFFKCQSSQAGIYIQYSDTLAYAVEIIINSG